MVSGFYKSRFFENQGEPKLPASTFLSLPSGKKHGALTFSIASLYLPIKSYVVNHMTGKDIEHFNIDPSECAKQVVDNLHKSKLWYWCGGSINTIWFNTTFLWHTFLVCKPHNALSNSH